MSVPDNLPLIGKLLALAVPPDHPDQLELLVGDGLDACVATFIPYVDCLASLPCDELQQHFALRNVVPDEERSSCGGLLRAQLDCQTAHY